MSSPPYFSLRVARIEQETIDARSFVLEIPDALRGDFSYRAGQFLTFRVNVGESRQVRCYSLSSSPESEREYKVTVKRVSGGRVSNHLIDHLEVGQELDVMRPAGRFCLGERQAPLLLFSAGSGITPVISLVKSALAGTGRAITVVYANRDRESIIFREELEELVRRHSERLRLIHRLDVEHGFLDVPAARKYAEEALDADFYICGPGPFMDVVEAALSDLSVPQGQIFIERFEIEEALAAEVESAPAPASAARAQVELDGKTVELEVGEGETLLEAARRAGLDAPFSCEDGYCGCCMAKVLEGRVEMRMNDGGVDDSMIAAGWILTCQGLVKTPTVRIQYPD